MNYRACLTSIYFVERIWLEVSLFVYYVIVSKCNVHIVLNHDTTNIIHKCCPFLDLSQFGNTI